MSATNYKQPPALDPRERRDEKQIQFMAGCIRDQAELDVLLTESKPDLRAAMLERLRPYLRFEPETVTADCPRCGLRRGTVIAHECTVN